MVTTTTASFPLLLCPRREQGQVQAKVVDCHAIDAAAYRHVAAAAALKPDAPNIGKAGKPEAVDVDHHTLDTVAASASPCTNDTHDMNKD